MKDSDKGFSMRTTDLFSKSKLSDSNDKQALCSFISTLHTQVNDLALALSVADGPELHEVWLNLANARAYLTTALDAARNIKNSEIHHYHI